MSVIKPFCRARTGIPNHACRRRPPTRRKRPRAYNPCMPSPTLLVARRILLALAFAVPVAAVQAQP
ncbi:MAG TPA: hypothetical protein VN280_02220, partial [Variovorax sp.]|nr:hypothetical protein [Variovorax sp.]